MSTTVDSRVVEMQFDNKHFEQNVKTSMSTLDKLKQSLNLTGAAKGFDNVSNAAKKVDMAGLSSGVENVRQRFSALEVMGVTALANITNSAVNTGKRMLAALTIDPIKTGFNEYETQINATQTILSNVKHKGKDLDDVNKALDELNAYADKTIYNFTEMTKNIGLFVNAGVGLDESVSAIKGFSNAAAMAGTDSTKTAAAMYQLSQAMSAGSVKLRDWMSLEQANITGERFQETIKMTARAHGIAIDDMIEKSGSLRETLKNGWLTSDLMAEALNHYTLSLEEMTSEEIAANRERLKSLGYTEEQIDKLFELGTEATDAATKVKTFTQLWDVLKESAQSGWSKTWKLIIGDFEGAKNLLTPLADFLTGILDKLSDARNNLIEGALYLPKLWTSIMNKLSISGLLDATGLDEIVDKVTTAKHSLEDFQDIVRKVWRGDYGNHNVVDPTIDRFTRLDAEGWDHRVVQDLVNKGYGYKITMEDVEASHKKFGLTMDKSTESVEQTADSMQDMTDVLINLTDEQLISAGLTEAEIKLFRDLANESKRTGKSIEDLVDEMSAMDGRTMLIESLKNVGLSLVEIFKALGKAWIEIFPPMSVVQLYSIISSIHDFSQKLVMGEKTADNLKRTLKGVFAVVDIIATIFGGALRIAFKVVGEILKYFNLDLLSFTAMIGDVLVGIRDWFDGLFNIQGILAAVIPWVIECGKAIGDWFASLQETEWFKAISKYLSDMATSIQEWFASFDAAATYKSFVDWIETTYGKFTAWIEKTRDTNTIMGKLIRIIDKVSSAIRGFFQSFKFSTMFTDFNGFLQNGGELLKNWFDTLYKSEGIAGDIIRGLVNGLGGGLSQVWDAAVNLANNIVTAVCNFLGIESPSTVFIAIGGFIIAGLLGGLDAGEGGVISKIVEIANGMISGFVEFLRGGTGTILDVFGAIIGPVVQFLKDLDLGPLFSTALGAGFIFFIYQLSKMLGGLGDLLSGFNDITVSVKRVSKAFSAALYAEAAKSFAIAIAILVGAITVLTLLDPAKMWSATIAVVAIIAALGIALTSINKSLKEESMASIGKLALLVLSLTGLMAAIAILAVVLGHGDDWNVVGKLAAVLVIVAAAIAGLLFVAQKMSMNFNALYSFAIICQSLLMVAGSIAILAIALAIIANLPEDAMDKSFGVLVGLAALVAGLILCIQVISKISGGSIAATSGTLLAIGGLFIMLAITMRILAGMNKREIDRASNVISYLAGVIVVLIATISACSLISGGSVAQFGSTMVGIGGAFLMMAITLHILAALPKSAMDNAIDALWKLVAMISVIIAVVGMFGPRDAVKLGGTMLALAGSIAIIAAIAVILGLVDPEGLKRGLTAVGLLVGMMAILVAVTGFANSVTGTIWALAGAIAVLALSIGLLTMVDPDRLKQSALAMTVLVGALAVVVACTKNVKGSIATLIMLTIAIALMAGVLVAMSALNVQNALQNAGALAIIMVAMAGVLAAMSFVGNKAALKKVGPALLSMIAMAGLLIAFAAALWVVDQIKFSDSIVDTVLLIGAVMTAMTLLLVPLTLIGKLGGWQSLIGVLALAAMAAALVVFAGALWVVDQMNIKPSMVNTILTITQLMTAMTLLLVPLSLIGILCGVTGGLPFMGILALTAMVIPLLAFAGSIWLIGKMNIASAIPIMGVLLTLFDYMTNILIKVSLISPLALVGVAALAALELVILAFAGIAVTIGALVDSVPKIGDFVNAGIPILVALSEGLGQVIGSFVGNLLGSAIEGAGSALIAFIEDIAVAFEKLGAVDMSNASHIKDLAEALLMITGAELLDQLSNLIFGDEGGFTDQLSSLAEGMKTFAEKSAEINQVDLANGISALLMLVAATETVPDQDWYVKLLPWGRGDETVFGEGLAALGAGINGFATSCKDINASKVKGGIDALLALIKASDEVPEAAWYEKILPWAGDDNAVFGEGLSALGSGIASFATNCKDLDTVAVTTGCAALITLIGVSKHIPDATWYEKVVPWARGDEEMFANGLAALGAGVSSFSSKCKDINTTAVTAGANALISLVTAAQNIPDAAWYEKLLWADSDEETFGKSLSTLGKGLAAFYESVNDMEFNATKMDAMTAGLSAAVKIANSGKISEETANSWKTALTNLGTGLYNFYTKGHAIISDELVDGVDEIFKSVKSVTDMIKTTDVSGTYKNLESLTAALDHLINLDAGSLSIVSTIMAITELNLTTLRDACSSIVDSMGTIALDMVNSFAKGVEDNLSIANDACAAMAEDAAASISAEGFEAAGKNVVTGFAKGIELNTWIAEEAARKMAEETIKETTSTIDSHSPSKVFMEIGSYVPRGFAIGIDRMSGMVKGSARSMAQASIDSVKGSIARLADVVSSDIDTQPTIRPVLDLSDVRMGANAIDGLLNTGSTLGVAANVNSINSMMNRRIQNGVSNRDVVSAIEKLNHNLGNVGNTSYTIDGITYDDGTNISTAVKELVRAARIERRV